MAQAPSEIVAALYRAAAGSIAWPEALRMVGDSVGGAFALIGFVDKVAARTNSITSEPFDPDRRSNYRNRYFELNPRVRHSARSPVGEVFYDAAIARDAELARHPYYAEYLAPRGFTHFIAANLENGPARRVNLSVQRSRRAGHVDALQVETFKAIVPHAIAAFELWEKLQGVSLQARLIAEAFDALDTGAFVLDHAGELLVANTAGAALIGAGGLFEADGRLIRAASAAHRDTFMRMIAAARASTHDIAGARPGRTMLPAADGRRFAVSARPLPEITLADGPDHAGVLILAEPLQRLSTIEELQQALGLSAPEAALALALADGVRPQDHAKKQGMAAEALRAQLESLRRKLGTHDRAAAAKSVAREIDQHTEGGNPVAAPWAKLYGLTPAEARLAAHLLKGGTTRGYAEAWELSSHTVRNQLRAIYSKTNTNRQVSLLQLLLRASGKNPQVGG